MPSEPLGPSHAAGPDSVPEVSVVCSVGARAKDLPEVHRAFREVLSSSGRRVEFLYVFDGECPFDEAVLQDVRDDGLPIRIFRMARGFGESARLRFAFRHARGRLILTVPDRFQVEPAAVLDVLRLLDEGAEVVVARRYPRRDALSNRFQSLVFHALVRRLSGRSFHDLTCGLRGFKREAALGLDLYGDLHRFIPILAAVRGYRVEEIPVAQRPEDWAPRVFQPRVYAERLLDILNVFFLTRFTRKPLRFFGPLGLAVGGIGGFLCGLLGWQRLFGGAALANRPLLLLAVLLVVMGIQLISLGLLGEIILFLSAHRDAPDVVEATEETEP